MLPQSRRHTYIASLLGIPHVVAAVNKMDLVDYSQESFDAIRREFQALCAQLGLADVEVIPVSALEGENVVTPSAAMPWYHGPTLLEYLETVPLARGGDGWADALSRCSLSCGPMRTSAASPDRSRAARCARAIA